MAETQWIESAYVLTTLPAPLSGRQITGSAVLSFATGKKRKRSEVATAIDGEGINIYNVENSNLVASFSTPPDSIFDTPPCSLYIKRSKQEALRRLTYATSRTSTAPQKARISCHEAASQESGSNTAHQELPSGAKVIFTDVLPIPNVTQEESQSHHVLALQRDSQISCYSEKLNQSIWSTKLADLPSASDGFNMPEGFEVRHAELLGFESASQGILSGRQDVLSVMDASDNAVFTHVLAVIGASPSVRHADVLDVDVHIYSLRGATVRNSTSNRALPQQLISWSIPQAVPRSTSSSIAFSLDAKSGALVEIIDGKVISFDLRGLSPKIIDTFTSRDKPETAIKLSSSLVLCASLERFSVYDSKFGSLLTSQAIPPPVLPASKKEKQKILDAGPQPIHFIGYSKVSGNVTAVRGNEILVVHIGEAARAVRRKRTGTLLIDSLAKGRFDSRLRASAFGSHIKEKRKRTRIGATTLFSNSTLDALAEEDNAAEFEKLFAQLVTTGRVPAPDAAAKDSGEMKPASASESDSIFASIKNIPRAPANKPHALYALSRMFTFMEPDATQSNTSGLRVQFYPENVFLWLVHTGQLRVDNIQRALDEYHGFQGRLVNGDVVTALAEFLDDLSLVHYVLTYHPNLDVDELTTAIKLIIQSLDQDTLPQPEHKPLQDKEFSNAAKTTGALTSGVGTGLGLLSRIPIPMLQDENDAHQDATQSEEDIESATDAAMRDVDELMNQAYETLDKLMPMRGESLRQGLARLNAMPREEVTKALRQYLTQHELIFLLHILRIELDQGGWTTRYGARDGFADIDMEDGQFEPSNEAITVITNMLNRVVDAIGMSGWLTTSSAMPIDDIDQTLTLLRGEISNTLEGVHEATFISGVLADLLRYSYRLHTAPGFSAGGNKHSTISVVQGNNNATTNEQLWQDGKILVMQDQPTPLLPMGLDIKEAGGVKTAMGRDEMRTRTMSGVARVKTKADVGREIRRGLPAYVFERIRF